MGVRPGDRVWCTAATGWSKSLRNVWLAAELAGCETVLHAGPLRRRRAARADRRGRAGGAVHVADRVPPLRGGRRVRPADLVRRPRGGGRRRGAGRRDRRALARGVRHRRPRRLRPDRDRRGGGRAGRRGAGAGIDGPAAARRRRPRSSTASCASSRRRCRRCSWATWTTGEATGRSLQDGLWHTGDLVRQDAEGRLWYEGRRDDVISSSGYRIGPGEVESALRSHPAVLRRRRSACPIRDRGQIVHADVVLAPGAVPSDELADRLRTHVREATAPYKYPRSLRFVDELPRTLTGKVRRARDPRRPGARLTDIGPAVHPIERSSMPLSMATRCCRRRTALRGGSMDENGWSLARRLQSWPPPSLSRAIADAGSSDASPTFVARQPIYDRRRWTCSGTRCCSAPPTWRR